MRRKSLAAPKSNAGVLPLFEARSQVQMSENYQEILDNEVVTRIAPQQRHEAICRRLHDWIGACMTDPGISRLLPARSEVQVGPGNLLCPDIAVVTTATGKVWLAIEVIDSVDHRPDTVLKKDIYEQIRIPRLWIVDPRYNNVEVYHSGEYGMTLKGIMAGSEILSEQLLPGFEFTIAQVFAK